MSRFAKIILPIAILAACLLGAWITIVMREEPERRQPPTIPVRVDAVRIEKKSYPVTLMSRGTVRPRTESSLIPEVSGTIVKVSPSFREGEFFEEGDVLLEIDPLNYRTAVVVAEGNRARAKAALAEEKARAAQAVENWKELGGNGPPGELALRRPQLAEAEANIEAANAELERAQRDLARTIVRAPFAGRVLAKNVDLGQYVTPGTVLGEIFAVDYVEIRLPLTNRQLSFIDLPMRYRDDSAESASPDLNYPPVEFIGQLGRERHTWPGKIVRVEGAIDERSRQLFVVAHVDDPYAHRENGSPPLMIGLFVEAAIKGNVLDDVFVVPRTAVRADSEVILIDDDHRLQRVAIKPLISDEDVIVIASGPDSPLKEGHLLCVTPLSFAANGVAVTPTVKGEAPPPEQPLTGPPGKKRGAGGPPAAGGRKKPGPPKAPEPAT